MFYSYLTSTASSAGEGDIHDVWGYKFRWTKEHLDEEQLKPLMFSYDTEGAEVLEHLHKWRSINGIGAAEGGGKEDLYETLKSAASQKEDEVINKFWKDVNTVPEWVDWEQIMRGQDVRKIINLLRKYRLIYV